MKKITDDKKFVRLVESMLKKFPFVQWDRFVYCSSSQGNQGIEAYGWIDRPGDNKKDFLLLQLWEDGDSNFNTSSKKYSLEIYRILCGTGRGHQVCKRVEDFFNVKNSIKIKTYGTHTRPFLVIPKPLFKAMRKLSRGKNLATKMYANGPVPTS